jgi:two-component system sensor histidine kinase AtoS
VLAEFAERLAHEVKNPLASIYGAMQVLARELADDDARQQVVEGVQRQVRRLDDTVLELLSFARPDPPRPRPTDVRGWIEELVEPLREPLAARGVRLEVRAEPELVAAIDGCAMGDALERLVANAAQAIAGAGAITIAARRKDGAVEIEIRDTGPGLPPGQERRLFEPFFTTKSRGLGLGLAIARRTIEAHGGTLAAEEAPGGACLRIVLPECPQPIS